jgi:hypothetical protein
LAGVVLAHGIGGSAAGKSVIEFVPLGIEYMPLGWDHLAFIAGIVFVGRGVASGGEADLAVRARAQHDLDRRVIGDGFRGRLLPGHPAWPGT